jgi:geranylgeranyl pyrophosphate synthase
LATSSVVCISSEQEAWPRVAAPRAVGSVNCLPLEDAFATSLPLPPGISPALRSALEHVLDHPGSLVRPRMVFQVGLAFGLAQDAAHSLAVALEYFHTSSLIFDDLPCMDNATDRRGAVCVHRKFGEHQAILAALALINRAYALTWQAMADSPKSGRTLSMAYLEQCLGVAGLLNGQSLDLSYSSLPHTRETTEQIALGKTVSLIRLTLVLPALLGGASCREIQLLERISVCWGLGYQIVDDLKDVLQSSEQTGKSAARDALLDRPSIATAVGVPVAIERLIRLITLGDRALSMLLDLRPNLLFLVKLRGDLQDELNRVTQNVAEEKESDLDENL